ncbi:MAG: hypothetical protein GY722_23650, partial [bacterium]|nr:hypothetical protein [bacterium]
MGYYRRTTSCWLISQALCFCLLLQGSGIAQALPLPPKQTFVSKSELEAAPSDAIPDPESAAGGLIEGFVDEVRNSAEEVRDGFERWLESRRKDAAAEQEAPVRVARAGGVLPLPPRLMAALLGSSSRGPAGPPSPPGLGSGKVEPTPPAEVARLAGKSATEEIPLLAGWNLISIPEEPADPDPAVVFANLAGQLARVEAYDACDVADPWKEYVPSDPAASDLSAVDHRIGMWVKANAAALLPSDGTLPATTTLELCEGWNLIGFPVG